MGGPGDLLAAVEVAGYGAGGPGMRGPVPGPVVWRGVRNWNQVKTTSCQVTQSFYCFRTFYYQYMVDI